jgi:hypothetical protein
MSGGGGGGHERRRGTSSPSNLATTSLTSVHARAVSSSSQYSATGSTHSPDHSKSRSSAKVLLCNEGRGS